MNRMPDVSFQVDRAGPLPFAAAPLLVFKLRVTEAESTPIHAVALRCHIRIEPAQRRYDGQAQGRLRDLFGEPARWSQTLRSTLWTHTSIIVPPFTGSTVVDLPMPCTYDFNVAATKYFDALEDGELPLSLLFSGTIFYEVEDAGLQVTKISWEKETNFRLPVRVWREMMEHYYPNSAWLCLRKDVFDRLHQYKSSNGLPTWEQALERLLTAEGQATP
jgi:hypothetical protein